MLLLSLSWLRLAIPLVFVMLWQIGIGTLLQEIGPENTYPGCKDEKFLYNMFFLVRDVYSGIEGITNLCVGQT